MHTHLYVYTCTRIYLYVDTCKYTQFYVYACIHIYTYINAYATW